jgi:hypothetical protein
MGASHRAQVLGGTAVATERVQQDGDPRVRLDDQLQHDVVEVRAMLPTVTAGDVDDLFRGLLIGKERCGTSVPDTDPALYL